MSKMSGRKRLRGEDSHADDAKQGRRTAAYHDPLDVSPMAHEHSTARDGAGTDEGEASQRSLSAGVKQGAGESSKHGGNAPSTNAPTHTIPESNDLTRNPSMMIESFISVQRVLANPKKLPQIGDLRNSSLGVLAVASRASCSEYEEVCVNSLVKLQKTVLDHIFQFGLTECDFIVTGRQHHPLDGTVGVHLNNGCFQSEFKAPLSRDDVLHLLQRSSPAGFGDLETQTTVIDPTVRNAHEICFPSFSASITIRCLADTAAHQLCGAMLSRDMMAEVRPLKLNLYLPGGHFDVHVDTPVAPNMVGTVVVAIPTVFGCAGGSLLVWPPGVQADDSTVKPFEWRVAHPPHSATIRYAAFWGDCKHAVCPVKEGVRVTVTFGIFAGKIKEMQRISSERPYISAPQPCALNNRDWKPLLHTVADDASVTNSDSSSSDEEAEVYRSYGDDGDKTWERRHYNALDSVTKVQAPKEILAAEVAAHSAAAGVEGERPTVAPLPPRKLRSLRCRDPAAFDKGVKAVASAAEEAFSWLIEKPFGVLLRHQYPFTPDGSSPTLKGIDALAVQIMQDALQSAAEECGEVMYMFLQPVVIHIAANCSSDEPGDVTASVHAFSLDLLQQLRKRRGVRMGADRWHKEKIPLVYTPPVPLEPGIPFVALDPRNSGLLLRRRCEGGYYAGNEAAESVDTATYVSLAAIFVLTQKTALKR